MSLTFRTIETNPYLPDDLWQIPQNNNMQVVDLGNVIRRHEAARSQRTAQAAPPFAEDVFSDTGYTRTNESDAVFYEPNSPATAAEVPETLGRNPFGPAQTADTPPEFDEPPQSAFEPDLKTFGGQPMAAPETAVRTAAAAIPEPDWDSATETTESSIRQVGHEVPEPAKEKPAGWKSLWPF